jgi:hypothetical protein
MTRLALVVVLVSVAVGCATPPRTSSHNRRVAIVSTLQEVFASSKAACESLDAEIVRSKLGKNEATVIARRQVAANFDYYKIHLSVQALESDAGEKQHVVVVDVVITSGDTSRTIDPKAAEYDEFWVSLWEVGRIMTFGM